MNDVPPYKIATSIKRYIPMSWEQWKKEYHPIYEGMSMENFDIKSIIENDQDLIFCGVRHVSFKNVDEGVWFLFPKKKFLSPMDSELKKEIQKTYSDSEEIDVGTNFLITSIIKNNTNYARGALHYLLEEGEINEDVNFVMGVMKEEENSEVDYLVDIRCLAITPNTIVYN